MINSTLSAVGSALDSAPLPTIASATAERVFFAVSPRSRSRFYPMFQPEQFAEVDYQWLDFPLSAGDWEKLLFKHRPTVLVTEWGTPPIPERFARAVDMPLRYVCHLMGTVRRHVPRHLLERGVRVSNWGTSISYTIAEHALLLTLGALRKMPLWGAAINQWPHRPDTTPRDMLRVHSLRGKRVGLHGFGSVARELVQLLKPFQVNLTCYSAGVPRAVFDKHGVRAAGSLRELFSTNDVIIDCEALTPESENSVTAEILACLPDDGVFVNVGRGHVVNEEALLGVLREGRLRVGLDVFWQEPLPPGSELLKFPTLLLSPHIAGPTEDAYNALWNLAMTNLQRYLHGAPLDALITPEIYDRLT